MQRVPLLPAVADTVVPLLPVQAGIDDAPRAPLLPVLAGPDPPPPPAADDREDDHGDGWWEKASSNSALHIIVIILGHAAVIGIGAPCAREAPTRPVLCGAVMPRVVLALLIGTALLYSAMFRASEVKALCLAGGIAAATLVAVQAFALLSRLMGDEVGLPILLQPVGAAVSLLTMVGAWLFTFKEEAMRKIFGLTTGDP